MADEAKKLDLSDLKKCDCGDTPSGDSNLMDDDEIGVSIMCIRCAAKKLMSTRNCRTRLRHGI